MKFLLRNILINIGSLLVVSHYLPSFIIEGSVRGLLIASLALMLANTLLVPFMKLLLLPLNLLTLGFFAWLANILALYILVTTVPSISISGYEFFETQIGGFTIPHLVLNTFQVAAVASFTIAVIMHILHWLVDK